MILTNFSPAVANGGQYGIHCWRWLTISYEKVNNIQIDNIVTRFYIIWTITWSVAINIGDKEINNNKKYTSNTGIFDCYVDAAVQCGVHRLMETLSRASI
jgi:hypothetical protein